MARTLTFPMEEGPNGDLLDPSVISVGLSFEVNWAFVEDQPVSYVYQIFDKHDRTVYVGITDDFAARWSSHLGKSWWATSVDINLVMLTGYLSRFDARVIEALLIAEHQPPCNTKEERKYVRIASTVERPTDVMMACLIPTRKF